MRSSSGSTATPSAGLGLQVLSTCMRATARESQNDDEVPADRPGRHSMQGAVQNMPLITKYSVACGRFRRPGNAAVTQPYAWRRGAVWGRADTCFFLPRLLKARGKVSKRLWWNQTERNRSHSVAAEELLMYCFGAIVGDQLNSKISKSCLDLLSLI